MAPLAGRLQPAEPAAAAPASDGGADNGVLPADMAPLAGRLQPAAEPAAPTASDGSDGGADNGVPPAETKAEAEAVMAAAAKALLGAAGVVAALPALADDAAFFFALGAAGEERGDSSDPPTGPTFPRAPAAASDAPPTPRGAKGEEGVRPSAGGVLGAPFSPLTEVMLPPAAERGLGPSAAGSRTLPEPDGMTPAVAARAAARASLAGGAAAASPASAAGGGWLACRFSSNALDAEDDERADRE